MWQGVMTDILERVKVHVVGPSQVNPMGHAVEMEADEFYELLHYAEELEDIVKGRIIRTFCWHNWEKWSDPFCGTWTNPEEPAESESASRGYMSQRRTCKKCGRVSYRKCR